MAKAFLDGSNLLLGAKHKGRPSVYVFACIFQTLRDRRFDCTAVFDDSIEHLLNKREGVPDEWTLLNKLSDHGAGAITFAKHTDVPLLNAAKASGGYVVSNRDRYSSWKRATSSELPHMVRVDLIGEMLSFTFEDDPMRSFSTALPHTVELFGQCFARTSGVPTMITTPIAPSENPLTQSVEARLIIFLLDASGSMCNDAEGARQTYDNRRKSDHLSEVLKETMQRFKTSTARDSFYISVLSFAGAAAVHDINGAKMAHLTHAANYVLSTSFDYLQGASGTGTDIAAALTCAVDLIDAALADPANSSLASLWQALIVVVTDGHHTGDRNDVISCAGKIAAERAHLQNNSIRLACVGIGNQCDIGLLTDIASEAEPSDIDLFKKASLTQYLKSAGNGYHPSLVVHHRLCS